MFANHSCVTIPHFDILDRCISDSCKGDCSRTLIDHNLLTHSKFNISYVLFTLKYANYHTFGHRESGLRMMMRAFHWNLVD